MLVRAGARAEKVAEFIVSPAEPGGRSRALEAPHGPVAAFDAAVILLQPVVQVATGPVPHTLTQLGPDRAGIHRILVRASVRGGPYNPPKPSSARGSGASRWFSRMSRSTRRLDVRRPATRSRAQTFR